MTRVILPPGKALTSPAMAARLAEPGFQKRFTETPLNDSLEEILAQDIRRYDGLLLFEWACQSDGFGWFREQGWSPTQIERHFSHEHIEDHAADELEPSAVLIQGLKYALRLREKCRPYDPVRISLNFCEMEPPYPESPGASCLVCFHQVRDEIIPEETPAYLQDSENLDLILMT
jgi:hypothetical protein